jgi:hypothetical protein
LLLQETQCHLPAIVLFPLGVVRTVCSFGAFLALFQPMPLFLQSLDVDTLFANCVLEHFVGLCLVGILVFEVLDALLGG